MPSTKDIKRRQTSVKNTQQVTRAMEMVAASKMRKAQMVALQSRPYAQKALSILSNIKQRQPDLKNIFLDGPSSAEATAGKTESKKTLAVVVTSDKGLCGGLNSAVVRDCSHLFEQYKKDGYQTELALIGIKSKPHFERTGLPIHETYKGAGDYITLEEVRPISQFIQKKYKSADFDKVVVVYTQFISTLKQKVARKQILPINEDIFKDLIESSSAEATGQRSMVPPSRKASEGRSNGQRSVEYIFEPSPQAVLGNLIPFLLDVYIYHIILESNASEHSARMVAMKNASDNAENILDALTLSYNKARQAAITKEITEITAGVNALQ